MAGTANLAPGSKNVAKLTCPNVKCKCLFLNPQKGSFTTVEDLQLPLPTPVANPDQVASEVVKHFWLVDDIYTFENMGFSLTVDKRKYLACPECEFGPLGFLEIDSNKSFVSIDRVKEDSSE